MRKQYVDTTDRTSLKRLQSSGLLAAAFGFLFFAAKGLGISISEIPNPTEMAPILGFG